MRQIMVIVIAMCLLFTMTAPVLAAKNTAKKKLNLDAQNIKRASEAIKRNQVLLKDKELLKKYQQLVNGLKANKK